MTAPGAPNERLRGPIKERFFASTMCFENSECPRSGQERLVMIDDAKDVAIISALSDQSFKPNDTFGCNLVLWQKETKVELPKAG
jgi:hypothetical protein